MLGMYVHTHWSYNYPYAARTWGLEDWTGYLQGLHGLGYDFVMIWPQLDTIPAEPTPSDWAFLEKLRQVIDLAHDRFGMRVAITACPNIAANEHAADYTFENRPYFICEKKINPSDPAQVQSWLEGRRRVFAPLKAADVLSVIDSDPGGYIGSTNAEFVELTRAQVEAFRAHNPRGEFAYWMLSGWENYNRFWEHSLSDPSTDMWGLDDWQPGCFHDTLAIMQERIPGPWWVYAFLPAHQDAIDAFGLRERACFFPYGVIEGEPTFPLTNYTPQAVAEALAPDRLAAYPFGVMANAQTHCLQLPHTYLFSHLARGGSLENLDLPSFAEDVLPGAGEVVARAWEVLQQGPPEDQAAAALQVRALRDSGRFASGGPLSGLLFGSPERFLSDLAMNLDVQASFTSLRQAVAGGQGIPTATRAALTALQAFQAQTGFTDACSGSIEPGFFEPLRSLGDPTLDPVIALFRDWRSPSIRNGLLRRLFSAVDEFCRTAGA